MTTFAIDVRRGPSTADDSCAARSTRGMSTRTRSASAVAQARSTWATACAYIVVYGVAFAFLLGPAGNLLAGAGSVADAQSARFTMILATALVLGVGSLSLSFGLGRTSNLAFATWGVAFAAIVAAFYGASAAVIFGGFVPAIAWAAVVGVLVPGAVAAVAARMTGPQLARNPRELAAGSLVAVAVVAVAVYLAVGVGSGTADIATIAGTTVLP